MFCAKCGVKNVDDASFCEQCGAPLSQAPVGSAAVQPQKQKKQLWKLYILCAAVAVTCMAIFIVYNSASPDAFVSSTFFQHDRLLVLTTEEQYTYVNSKGEFPLQDTETPTFLGATPFGPNGLAIVEPVNCFMERLCQRVRPLR